VCSSDLIVNDIAKATDAYNAAKAKGDTAGMAAAHAAADAARGVTTNANGTTSGVAGGSTAVYLDSKDKNTLSSATKSASTNAEYRAIAQELGLSTAPDSPYKDIIDCMLGTGGFNSFTGVSVNNGAATLDYDSRTGKASIAYFGGGSNGTITKQTDIIIAPSFDAYGKGQTPTFMESWSILLNSTDEKLSGIVLSGNKANWGLLFDELQKLTDHTLGYDEVTGKVYIKSFANNNDINYKNGNILITRLLYNPDNPEYIIYINRAYNDNYHVPGTNCSTIFFNPYTKTKVPTIDSSTGNNKQKVMPAYIALAHELIHVDRTIREVRQPSLDVQWQYQSWRLFGKYPQYKSQSVAREDLAVIGLKYNDLDKDITENMIRTEHFDDYGIVLPLRGGY
jgi:hypothetical protein